MYVKNMHKLSEPVPLILPDDKYFDSEGKVESIALKQQYTTTTFYDNTSLHNRYIEILLNDIILSPFS